VVRDIGPADDRLDDVGGMTTRLEGASRDGGEVGRGPGGGFGALDDNCVACEDGGNDGRNQVVKWIVPRDQRSNHTQGLVHDLIPLVHHKQICLPSFIPQALLPMPYRPPQLLRRNQDLSQRSIHHRLARIQARYSCNRLLVLKHKLEHSLEHLPALGKRRLRPLRLCLLRFGNGAVDVVYGGGVDAAERFACGRGVALDERRA
jgi:hypothetical protein